MEFSTEELSTSPPMPAKEILAGGIHAPSIYFEGIARTPYALAIFVVAITFVEHVLANNSSVALLP